MARRWRIGIGSRVTAVLLGYGPVSLVAAHVRLINGGNMTYDVWASWIGDKLAPHVFHPLDGSTHVVVNAIDTEGVNWCRGWEGEAVTALRAAQALG